MTPDAEPRRATFTVEPDAQDGCVVVVDGEVDIASAAAFDDAVTSAIALSPERVAFDLSGTTFFDSSGLAVLLAAANRATTVTIRRASAAARRVIEVSGLTDTLGLHQ